ncbi:MAG: adenylate/guanylate cyclase domain-containing protein [Cyanobacteriota bacterium]|nr:adenylate/guanylate cyclase domain-containing protein [Cyanobacteriota bacterium]
MNSIYKHRDRTRGAVRDESSRNRFLASKSYPKPKQTCSLSAIPSGYSSHPISTEEKPDRTSECSKPVILCVDDELMILNSLKQELELVFDNKYTIEVAECGEEALEVLEDLIAENRELALVISDCIMPQMRGDELLQRIHEISPQTIKVMLTGQAGINEVVNAINHANLYRYLTKPWHYADLQLTIQAAINSYLKKRQISTQNEQLRAVNQELKKRAAARAKTIDILSHREKTLDRLNHAYQRFVPDRFLQYLQKDSIVDVELGDRIEQNMSVLYSDIRNFTALSEKMSPEDNFKFINAYLSRMEPTILEHQGFIEKYMGDAIIAVFGGNADNAVKSGIEMLRTLERYNRSRQKIDRQPISIGLGIDTGNLMLGTVGGRSRMDSAAIGEAVFLANRLEQLTKQYRLSLLISQETFAHLENPFDYQIRYIDRVRVESQSQWRAVFEVFDADRADVRQKKLETKSDFERAVVLFGQRQFSAALDLFEACWDYNPQDAVTRVYLHRCGQLLQRGRTRT